MPNAPVHYPQCFTSTSYSLQGRGTGFLSCILQVTTTTKEIQRAKFCWWKHCDVSLQRLTDLILLNVTVKQLRLFKLLLHCNSSGNPVKPPFGFYGNTPSPQYRVLRLNEAQTILMVLGSARANKRKRTIPPFELWVLPL